MIVLLFTSLTSSAGMTALPAVDRRQTSNGRTFLVTSHIFSMTSQNDTVTSKNKSYDVIHVCPCDVLILMTSGICLTKRNITVLYRHIPVPWRHCSDWRRCRPIIPVQWRHCSDWRRCRPVIPVPWRHCSDWRRCPRSRGWRWGPRRCRCPPPTRRRSRSGGARAQHLKERRNICQKYSWKWGFPRKVNTNMLSRKAF